MWGRGSHWFLLRCIRNASKHEGSRSAAGRGRLHSWVENGWERQMQSGAELIQARQGTPVDKLGCSFAETRLGFSAGGRHGGGWRGGREQGVCIRLMTTGTDDPSSEAQHMRNSVGSDEGHSAEVGVTAAVVEGSAVDGGNLPVTAAGAEEGSSTEFEDLAPTAGGAEGGTSSTSDEDVPAPAAGEEVSSTDDVVGLQAGDSVSSGSLHAEAANDPILGGGTPANAEDFTTSAEHERMIAGTGQAVDSVDATGATLQSTPDDLLTNPEEQEISESEEAKQKMAELAEELNKSLEDFKKARSHTAKVYVHIKSFEKIRPGGLTNVRSAGLPARRSLFTINRSPHVDKKARDQFQMKVHKHLLVIETETHKLHEKLHQLRNHDLPGVQLKVTFHYQTRLDMSKLA